ncbi:MAG: hypothetical protein WC530_09480 [Candidatus Omnitrophota bacterium]|jgi:hypothetical protein
MKLTTEQNNAIELARAECRVKLNAATDDHMDRIRVACISENEVEAAVENSRNEYMKIHNAAFFELRNKLNEIIP